MIADYDRTHDATVLEAGRRDSPDLAPGRPGGAYL